MTVEIDNNSGFCFGVRRAIATLEEQLAAGKDLYCVGDIVHNEREIDRLRNKGLKVIEAADLPTLSNVSVLFRAHGEPPASYNVVRQNNLDLTDATCPVVLKLQQRIRLAYANASAVGGQVVIFGKKGHAEVIGLMGQTDGHGILIENQAQVEVIDPTRPVEIFAQTTKNPQDYEQIVNLVRARSQAPVVAHDTICRQMAQRADHLPQFAQGHDVIVFVGGAKSSNSKVLFDICNRINPHTHFVTTEQDVNPSWFTAPNISIGITGATSTPLWLMEQIKSRIESLSTPMI